MAKFKVGDRGKTVGGWDYIVVNNDKSANMPLYVKHTYDGRQCWFWHYADGRVNTGNADFNLTKTDTAERDQLARDILMEWMPLIGQERAEHYRDIASHAFYVAEAFLAERAKRTTEN